MRDEQDRPLYDLWRVASSNGYSLRLEGDYIRLVPLKTQGDAGLPRTFRWNKAGIKAARAWLETPDMPQRVAAAGGAGD